MTPEKATPMFYTPPGTTLLGALVAQLLKAEPAEAWNKPDAKTRDDEYRRAYARDYYHRRKQGVACNHMPRGKE